MKKQLTEAQLNANRANAQKSTGPKSPEGKARSSMNAWKHGITSRKVVIDDENHENFNRLLNDYRTRFQPADGYELRIVDDLCLLHWHMTRLHYMESAALQLEIYRPDFLGEYTNVDPVMNPMLAFRRLMETVPNFLPTLNLQLNRLSREYERLTMVLLRVRKECPPIAPAEPEAATPDEPVAGESKPPAPCLENEPAYSPTLQRAIVFMKKPIFKPLALTARAA